MVAAGDKGHLENGDEKGAISNGGDEVTLLAEYSEREREIMLEGGVLRQLRKQKPAEVAISKGTDTTDPGASSAPDDYPNPEVPRG